MNKPLFTAFLLTIISSFAAADIEQGLTNLDIPGVEITIDGGQAEHTGEHRYFGWSRILVPIANSDYKVLMVCRRGQINRTILSSRPTVLGRFENRILSESELDIINKHSFFDTGFENCNEFAGFINSSPDSVLSIDRLSKTIAVFPKQ